MAIQYSGIDSLDETEKFKLIKISEREYPKITIHLPDATLMLIIKKHSKTGNRHKYSLHAKVDNPTLKFRAETFAWDISEATHKIFEKLHNEIKKKYED